MILISIITQAKIECLSKSSRSVCLDQALVNWQSPSVHQRAWMINPTTNKRVTKRKEVPGAGRAAGAVGVPEADRAVAVRGADRAVGAAGVPTLGRAVVLAIATTPIAIAVAIVTRIKTITTEVVATRSEVATTIADAAGTITTIAVATDRIITGPTIITTTTIKVVLAHSPVKQR